MIFSSTARFRTPFTGREFFLWTVLGLLTAIALWAPELHARAEGGTLLAPARVLGALAGALDVLSNLPLLAVGVLGLLALHRVERERGQAAAHEELPHQALDCAWLFFAGLVLVALASAFHHLQPDAARLAAERTTMAVAFAGAIGMAVSDRVSTRAGWPATWFTLGAGLLAVAVFQRSGNAMPWAVVQFGGMALMAALALLAPVRSAVRGFDLRLGLVVALYALAKSLEAVDATVADWSGHLLSGHSLKHLAAAAAAWPVLHAVRQLARTTPASPLLAQAAA